MLDLSTGELTDEVVHVPSDSLDAGFKLYASEINNFRFDRSKGLLEFDADTCGILIFLRECELDYTYSRSLALSLDRELPPLHISIRVSSILSYYYRLIVNNSKK